MQFAQGLLLLLLDLSDAGQILPGNTSRVEGAHGELRSRFADGLRGDDAHRRSDLDFLSGSQIPPVAAGAHPLPLFAHKRGPDPQRLHAGRIHRRGNIVADDLARREQHLALARQHDVFQRGSAANALAQRLDDLIAFLDGGDLDPLSGAAVNPADDDVLRHVHEPPGQISGVRRPERGVGKALARTVGGDEVLQHRQPLVEVGLDGKVLDEVPERIAHESAHSGELRNLLRAAARPGVRDRVNRIALVQVLHNGISDLLRRPHPQLLHFALALALGDAAGIVELLLHGHSLFGLADDLTPLLRAVHVSHGHCDSRAARIRESEGLQLIEQLNGALAAVVGVAGADQLRQTLLVQSGIGPAHALRQNVVEQNAPGGGDGLDLPPLLIVGEHGIDGLLQMQLARRLGERDLLGRREHVVQRLTVPKHRHEVCPENDVLLRRGDGPPVGR